MVMLEQIRTVNQDELEYYIGEVADPSLKRCLTNSIKKTFGLWNYNPKDPATVRCLCPRCLDAYRASGKYIVRGLDPFQRERDKCDKCDRIGGDYVITERIKQ